MGSLFEEAEINGMTLSNRFVRSATWDGLAADDGACTDRMVDLLAELAKGGVGLRACLCPPKRKAPGLATRHSQGQSYSRTQNFDR